MLKHFAKIMTKVKEIFGENLSKLYSRGTNFFNCIKLEIKLAALIEK